MRSLTRFLFVASLVWALSTAPAAARDFYISSSSGNDSTNDGMSESSPWASFAKLSDSMPLLPGDRILLRRGDSWSEELNITGKGSSGSPVELTAYGTGPRPLIERSDVINDLCVVWQNASYVRINSIECRTAKLGIYLRYTWTDPGGTDVVIEDCVFADMPDDSFDPSLHNFEYAWSDAIFVGGQAWSTAEFSTRLDGLTIRDCEAVNCARLFGTGWYYPSTFPSRLKNLTIEDSVARDCLAGSVSLINVDGGNIRRVHAIGGGGRDTSTGASLGRIRSSKNIVIEDSAFGFMERGQGADSSGFVFEGNTQNVTFRNCVIHDCDGPGIEIAGTEGAHTNLVIEDNVLYNNARNPWNSEETSELMGSSSSDNGLIRNNGIYRGNASINFLSPNSNWSGFTLTGSRQLEYSSVSGRPRMWEWETPADFEGWGNFNQWQSPTVSGGALTGTSTGADPSFESPPTWSNTALNPIVWIRMQQSAGNFGQVFFLTESDPVWDSQKSVFFPIVADGTFRDYFIDLKESMAVHGVITQIRLDPTTVSGATTAVDFLRLTDSMQPDPFPVTGPPPQPQVATFTSIASEDGHVLESAADSGTGGSVSAFSSTLRLGDDASNRAYRPILSFDTSSLPDDAFVVSATLSITRVGNPVGTIPIGVATPVFGKILVDLAVPGFGASSPLQADDWAAAPSQPAVSQFAWPAFQDGMSIFSRLEEEDNGLINLAGKTQFRIRYENDDDGDNTSDYMSYASGNSAIAAFRPTLTIEYYPDTDSDLDGIADWWEELNFGGLNGASASTDLDGDGSPDAGEFEAGSDPRDPASLLKIESFELDVTTLTLTWQSEAGRSYRISEATNLVNGFAPKVVNLPATPPQNTHVVDPVPNGNAFYRIELEP